MNFRKIVGSYDEQYPALDPTTPYYEFLSYQECCISLGIQVRLNSFIRYHNYLKSNGIR